jgi:hypothetical protein
MGNVGCLPRKVAGSAWSQPKREAMWVAASKAIGMGMPKSFGTHIITAHTLDVGCGTIGFNVCNPKFLSCFGPIPPSMSLSLSFGMEMFALCHCILKVCNFGFDFTGVHR